MNPKRAKELLPVIQAFADGRVIEYSDDDRSWVPIAGSNPEAYFIDRHKYRIKPEPLVIYVRVHEDGTIGEVLEDKDNRPREMNGWKTRKFIEPPE